MKSGDFNLFEHLVKHAEFPQVLNWLGSATRCALVGTSLQMNTPGNRSISDEALSLLQASLRDRWTSWTSCRNTATPWLARGHSDFGTRPRGTRTLCLYHHHAFSL